MHVEQQLPVEFVWHAAARGFIPKFQQDTDSSRILSSETGRACYKASFTDRLRALRVKAPNAPTRLAELESAQAGGP